VRILLTGASSFTGYWFARALRKAGHEVVAPLRGRLRDYDVGPRAERVRRLQDHAILIEDCPFGGERFLEVAERWDFGVFCHHAALVGDYRNPDYDVAAAFIANTRCMPQILRRLGERGLIGVVFTGTFSEQRESIGTKPLRAFNPYSLAKGLTADAVEYWCGETGLSYGKFTLPNPFGPLEEARFCGYLVACWKANRIAQIRTPVYVRDNMHVDLLALSYADFVARLGETRGLLLRRNPSGYIESQGGFTARFAEAMRRRCVLACDFELIAQTEFSEPMVRVNYEPARPYFPAWDEEAAWDAIAEYYDLPQSP
jgi:UDP-glucose 4-epimerase